MRLDARLSVCVSVRGSACPSLCPSARPPASPSACPSKRPPASPPARPSARVSVRPSVRPPAREPARPSVRPTVRMPNRPSVCQSHVRQHGRTRARRPGLCSPVRLSPKLEAQGSPCGPEAQGSPSGLEAQASPAPPPSASTATTTLRHQRHPTPCTGTARGNPPSYLETGNTADVITDSHSMHADPHKTV